MPQAAPEYDLVDRVDHLFEIERGLRSLIDSRLAPESITYARFRVLRAIRPLSPGHRANSTVQSDAGGTTAADLMCEFGFAQRTVSVAVKWLAAEGFITHVAGSRDRRQQLLNRTNKGDLTVQAGEKVLRLVFKELFLRTTVMQKQTMWVALPMMAQNIAKIERKHQLREKRYLEVDAAREKSRGRRVR